MDVGSISTKGVLLDEGGEIAAQAYLWTEGDPVGAVQRLLRELTRDLPAEAEITAVGTTGSARKLVGAMLEATVVKNEITAHAVGTLSKCPDVRTILEIGGQDAKIILLENGVVADYAMNTLCAAGTGAFLTSQAKRLGLNVEEMGEWALRSRSPAKIAARCTVFAETDMVHKAQVGVSKEDLVAGLCAAVVSNYLNNVGKGKKIYPPVVFQGGVSKNAGVVAAFEQELELPVIVPENGHLMGALGVALLARRAGGGKRLPQDITETSFKTEVHACPQCANHCEIVCFYRKNQLIDHWGNRCERGMAMTAAGNDAGVKLSKGI